MHRKRTGHKRRTARQRRNHKIIVRVAQSALVGTKAVLGVTAFKLTEVALHTGQVSHWAAVFGISGLLLFPAAGLLWLEGLLED